MKRKWKKPRSSLRDRLDRRKEGREYSVFSRFGQDTRGGLSAMPMALVKQLGDNMFEKTVAAIIVVICLGTFSLLNTGVTNRIVDYAHRLTVMQMQPAAWIDTAKPVIESIRDFSWRKEDVQTHPQPDNEEIVTAAPGEMAHPVNGVLSSPFGTRLSSDGENLEMHYGIDVAADAGSPVYAAFAGTVSLIKEHDAYGTTIYIGHPGEMVTIYGRVTESLVSVGDAVEQGAEIAKVAVSSEGENHLHFEIWEEKQPVDPETFLTDTN